MNIRRRLLFAATGCASLALALSGCAGLAPQPAVTVTAPAADSGGSTSTPAPGERSSAPDEASAAPVPSPSLLPDQCAPLTEAADGVYAAGDAGSATVVRVGPRGLELRSVDAAAGWTAHVDDQDGDSVEVTFRQGPVRYDLDIEIDDGAFQGTVCRDDD